MVCARTVLFALLIAFGGAAAISVNFGDNEWKAKPVAKVVALLEDMQHQLEVEQDGDEDLYDKMTCWCEANDKGKTKAIAEATQRSADLSSSIEYLTAKSAQLQEDITTFKGQIAANEAGLETATALRAKEAAEFHTNEADAVQASENLDAAMVTLGKHNEGALSHGQLLQLQQVLNAPLARRLGLTAAHSRVAAMLQTGAQAPTHDGIYGALQGMKASFDDNLAKSRKDEAAAVATFTDMKAAKAEELAAGRTAVENKGNELADADDQKAQAAEDLEDTNAQLETDKAFLADVKSRCAVMDKQFADRTAMRAEETKAVSEALAILQDDDAKDLMSRSTFFQTSSTASRGAHRLARTALALKAAARKFHDPEVAAVAAEAGAAAPNTGDVMETIKASIDKLVVNLKQEQKDEVEKKDWCRQELHDSDMDLTAKYESKEAIETIIANHDALVLKLKNDILSANTQIKDTQVAVQAASENRLKADAEAQATAADQKATQEVLKKALEKLQSFYSKQASLLQRSRKQNPLVGSEAPASFAPYKKAGGAGGVMGFIENIIADSKKVQAEAQADEQEELAAYEQFTKDSAAELTTLQQEVADKTARLASADGDLVRAKTDHKNVIQETADAADLNKETHEECDYVINNFETRQKARTDEMEALAQAKQMLSGMQA